MQVSALMNRPRLKTKQACKVFRQVNRKFQKNYKKCQYMLPSAPHETAGPAPGHSVPQFLLSQASTGAAVVAASAACQGSMTMTHRHRASAHPAGARSRLRVPMTGSRHWRAVPDRLNAQKRARPATGWSGSCALACGRRIRPYERPGLGDGGRQSPPGQSP